MLLTWRVLEKYTLRVFVRIPQRLVSVHLSLSSMLLPVWSNLVTGMVTMSESYYLLSILQVWGV